MSVHLIVDPEHLAKAKQKHLPYSRAACGSIVPSLQLTGNAPLVTCVRCRAAIRAWLSANTATPENGHAEGENGLAQGPDALIAKFLAQYDLPPEQREEMRQALQAIAASVAAATPPAPVAEAPAAPAPDLFGGMIDMIKAGIRPEEIASPAEREKALERVTPEDRLFVTSFRELAELVGMTDLVDRFVSVIVRVPGTPAGIAIGATIDPGYTSTIEATPSPAPTEPPPLPVETFPIPVTAPVLEPAPLPVIEVPPIAPAPLPVVEVLPTPPDGSPLTIDATPTSS